MKVSDHMLQAVVQELYAVAGYAKPNDQVTNAAFSAYPGAAGALTANVYGDLGAFRFVSRRPGRVMVHVMLFKNDGNTFTVTLGASLDGGADVDGSSSSIGSFGSSDEAVTVDVPTPGIHKLMLRGKSSGAITSGNLRVIAYAWQFMESA